MTNTQHTPGPWHFDRHGYELYVNSGNTLIAALSMDGKLLETSEANARLIAAAPTLLEALQNARNVLAGIAAGDIKTIRADSPALSQARAAIRQATGQE